jgi:hypothetical protein
MDLGFFRRGLPSEARRSAACLDHGVLTAALQAYQAASVTARTQARGQSCPQLMSLPQDSLVEILLGGPRWREAVDEQGGSFNAAFATVRGRDD